MRLSMLTSVLMPFWSQLASTLPPKIHPKRSKTDSKKHQTKLIDFCFNVFQFLLHFGSQVGPFEGRVGLQKPAKDGPNVARTPLRGRGRPNAAQTPQMTPKQITLQDLQNDHPDPPKLNPCAVKFPLV